MRACALAFMLVLLTLVSCGIAPGQTERPPVDWAKLSQMVDAVRAGVDAKDLKKAGAAITALNRAHFEESKAQFATAAERLREYEASAAAANERARHYLLPGLARTAFDAGDMVKAERYARELVAGAGRHPENPPATGTAIHDGNMVLGRIALKSGDVVAAKAYLLAAAGIPAGTGPQGKPQGPDFFYKDRGPNMSLAKELIETGEWDAVHEFLTLCRVFWTGKYSSQMEGSSW